MWPVSTLVNKADNDGPELLERVEVASALMEHAQYVAAIRTEATRSRPPRARAGVDAHGRVVSRVEGGRSARSRRAHPALGDADRADAARAARTATGARTTRRNRPTAIDWFADGSTALADALASAAPDDEVWTWTPDHERAVLGAAHGPRGRGAPLGRADGSRRSAADRPRARGRRDPGGVRHHAGAPRGQPADAAQARRSTSTAPTARASGCCASRPTAWS